MKLGMTSVTFRSLSPKEIISLSGMAGLEGIEWGGDIHLPPGETSLARRIAADCQAAGQRVFSYGSYYHGLQRESFLPVVKTAAALGAPAIRVWAGTAPPERVGEGEFCRLVDAFKEAARMAAEEGILLTFEYHRETMTQTREGALRLLEAIGAPNVRCSWQPNPDLSLPEQEQEIAALGSRLYHCHVFFWEKGNLRRPLAEGRENWERYIAAIRKANASPAFLMEFVKDDAPGQFLEDVRALKNFVLKSFFE